MKMEKKLIVTSILALLIGVSSVVPLLFLMSGTAKAETGTEPEPQYDLKVLYAYIAVGNSSFPSHLDKDLKQYIGSVDDLALKYSIVFNATNNFYGKIQPDFPDAQVDYYLIQFSSEKGLLLSYTYFTGVSYKPSMFNLSSLRSFIFDRDEWFDTRNSTGTFGVSSDISPFEIWIHSASSSELVSAFGEPETLFLDISRIGSITFNGNSTIVSLSKTNPITHIQLQRFGNGFLCNTIITDNDLTQIDLFRPPIEGIR
jgi:hypothetical protein